MLRMPYRFAFTSLILLLCLLSACNDGPPDLTTSFTAYEEVRFRLPEGWQPDLGGDMTEISGGYGFRSPDYAGLTYLRLHQGATFAVMGDWEPTQDAASALQVAFVDSISPTSPIEVLGQTGTYAHGQLEQGQGVGAVHLIYQQDGQPRQLIFIVTVADEWENYEATFFEIIKSLEFVG